MKAKASLKFLKVKVRLMEASSAASAQPSSKAIASRIAALSSFSLAIAASIVFRASATIVPREAVTKPARSILFVCLGNICRSPLAEGVFRAVLEENGAVEDFELDSAGTGAWHLGSAPDPRSIAIAAAHGIDISRQAARKVSAEDFERFDLILGMDISNVDDLRAAAPSEARERIHLFLDYAGARKPEVPDPYYGGAEGFADVYRMLREASESLAAKLGARTSAPVSGHVSSTT